MKQRITVALVFAILAVAGAAWLGRSHESEHVHRAAQASQAISSSPGGGIDCTRGVACPIIWQPPLTPPPQ
jgi:hypothetical protein